MQKRVDVLALALATIGAINWGLVGLFEFDLVATLVGLEFGETNLASRVVYGLVGLSGLYLISYLPRAVARGSEARQSYA
jgi:uncharacterized membrane protein YuzA (DUF378 family)